MEVMQTKTPKNIDELTVQEVLDLVQEPPYPFPSKKARYKVLKLIYDVLGYELTNDVIFALLAEDDRQLILATAGGGKTTTTQIKLVLEKIIRKNRYNEPLSSYNILCLVYNRHNVIPMADKHKEMVNRLYMAGVKGISIDGIIDTRTMHSFCEYWRKEYPIQFGLEGRRLVEEADAKAMMSAVSKAVCKKHDIKYDLSVANLMSLYGYIKENLLDLETADLKYNDRFIELKQSKELLQEIFEAYENHKVKRKAYEYLDLVVNMDKLLKTDKSVRDRLQEYYQYIVVDEIQDFTPLMISVLKGITGEGVPLVCIGDEDQAIYSFRGADLNTVLKFQETFNGGVYSLNRNRRCGSAIVEQASKIIKLNTKRYNKILKASNRGGRVELKPYTTEEGQLIKVFEYLTSLTPDERMETAVAYRDRRYSMQLAEMLEEKNIPFNIISGFRPFGHELYRHVEQVLDLLYSPYNKNVQVNMYKVIGIDKNKWFDLLGYDPRKMKFSNKEVTHFVELNYGEYASNARLIEDVSNLLKVSKAISKLPLVEYFDIVFEMILRNFWNGKSAMNDDPLDDIYTRKVRDFFNVNKTYEELFKELDARKKRVEGWTENKTGITLSTFHGLKGLEFDRLLMIYMSNDIFPNYEQIELREYPGEVEQDLKEAENRLCYVAMTRPKHLLQIYYPRNNPSYYVQVLKASVVEKQREEETPSQAMNLLDEPFGDTTVYVELHEEEKEEEMLTSNNSLLGRFW